jgi:8-amino-7-oxononanoate synthase
MTTWNLSAELARLEAARLYRAPRELRPCGAVEGVVDGRRSLVFCSNDYLGLAQDRRLAEAFRASAEREVGSGGAHLISGHRAEHQALEEELAAFLGRERALLFSTGFMANVGIIDALLGSADVAFQDRLNHASLLDGARLSGARLVRYRHGDSTHLGERLSAVAGRRRLIATDGVFSMDGDVAPLPHIAELAREHDALLMVDDAHGLGVLGRRGGGCVDRYGLDQAAVPLLVGTLGKALGTFGAFAAGSRELIEYLVQKARTYVYTTAPPPAVAAATRVALRLVQEEPWRRERLHGLVKRFRAGAAQLGLPLLDSETPIQLLVVGAAERALELGGALIEDGLLVGAIRPPVVPAGSARLRITFSAAHTERHVDTLLAGLERHWRANTAAVAGGLTDDIHG